MNSIDVLQRRVGINFSTQNDCEILVWAPRANNVVLHISGSNKRIQLQKKERGYWGGSLSDIYPGVNYFINVDETSYPDPASVFQPFGFDGPSQALDLNAFAWQDKLWKNISISNYIIYELHVGTFTAEGTFTGIETKLEYLKQLGITAIELMPIAQFPGTRNWGYDGVFPFAVQNSYGGPASLQHLINTCHQHGLAVILDVVYNHF
ncbi:MAG TPA: alpha-amylase family glycosyl hydrolase, partial [Cyclobacteriaceae bacterium]